jgi:hypothetical protein
MFNVGDMVRYDVSNSQLIGILINIRNNGYDYEYSVLWINDGVTTTVHDKYLLIKVNK